MLHFEILLHHAVRCVWYVVHDDVEVDFFGFVAVSVEGLAHFDAIRVVEHLEDLQLSVLVPLVLEYLLDSYSLSCLSNRRFEDHTK